MRVFVYDDREFPDPDPKLKVDEVRQYYTTFFPELSNAESKESKRPNKENPAEMDDVITFKKRVGTKGCRLGYCTTKNVRYGGGQPKEIKEGRCPVCKGKLEKA